MDGAEALTRTQPLTPVATSSRDMSRLQDHLVSPTLRNVQALFLDENPGIQWFGVDIGGTLVKCVYFETACGGTTSSAASGQQHEGLQHEGLQHGGLQREGLQHEGLQHGGQQHEGLQHGGLQREGQQHEGLQHEGLQREGQQHEGQQHEGLQHEGQQHEGQRQQHEGLQHEGQQHEGQRQQHEGLEHGGQQHEGQRQQHEGVQALKKFVKSNLKYGSSGMRDKRLELAEQSIGSYTGTLHFIKFATSRMDGFFDMVTKNGLSTFSKVVCATGGGAFKFEEDFNKKLGIKLCKFDEMESLIRGLHYLALRCPNECYYWSNPKQDSTCKVPFDLGPNPYPYIIVNVGSGVSILLVESATSFRRIGGTSVGGGTFLGLCAMLTGTDSFENAIELAEKGDSNRVDKLVRDIYGGDYVKLGLSGDVVASSFGHMTNPERRKDVRPEDLAKATLVTVTNNIAAIARMSAMISGVEKVVFVGNYLCGNKMSMQMLAFAMEYWSQGNTTVRALFLEHEGYFGALGSMLFYLDPLLTTQHIPHT